jgi:enamine deaminase RidA (YjgF/YER057c/UK114 family)
MSSPDARIEELKLQLPPAPKPMGVYKPCLVVDKFVYVSGHGPYTGDGSEIVGTVGKDLSEAEGKAAARQVGLAILSTLRAHLGSLDRVRRVVKVLGMVNATPDFARHPAVINGCSELFVEIWGPDLGVGVRSAVGMGSLPSGIPVEIEGMFELA